MAIKNMINTRNPGELREFQTRMIQLGRIRTGVFETPPGKRGRPVKLDRFRFTSPDRDLIAVIAQEYGGIVEEFKPQGAGMPGWQVTSDADRIPVYIVNGQRIDPTYEAWSAGRRCIRRCDGEWNAVEQAPCVCNGLHPTELPPAAKDLCKPTTRVNLMLPVIEGIGSWMYESHGENFAIENGGVLAHFVATAPVPVPAWFALEAETRQHRKPEGGFEKRDFYVARLRVTGITPEQAALGADVVSRILTQGGAPAVLSGDRARALEAAPVSAVPAAAPVEPPVGQPPLTPDMEISAELRAKILADIESRTTVEALDGVKAKLQARGITDQAVRHAWRSKYNAVEAAAVLDGKDEYQVGDTVNVGGVEFTKIADGPFAGEEPEFRDPSDGALPEEDLGVFGIDEREFQRQQEDALDPDGIEDATGPGSGLPMVPAGSYDVTEQWSLCMTRAGQPVPAGAAEGVARPLTTDQVSAAVVAAFELKHPGEATGEQLARIAEALKLGLL